MKTMYVISVLKTWTSFLLPLEAEEGQWSNTSQDCVISWFNIDKRWCWRGGIHLGLWYRNLITPKKSISLNDRVSINPLIWNSSCPIISGGWIYALSQILHFSIPRLLISVIWQEIHSQFNRVLIIFKFLKCVWRSPDIRFNISKSMNICNH